MVVVMVRTPRGGPNEVSSLHERLLPKEKHVSPSCKRSPSLWVTVAPDSPSSVPSRSPSLPGKFLHLLHRPSRSRFPDAPRTPIPRPCSKRRLPLPRPRPDADPPSAAVDRPRNGTRPPGKRKRREDRWWPPTGCRGRAAAPSAGPSPRCPPSTRRPRRRPGLLRWRRLRRLPRRRRTPRACHRCCRRRRPRGGRDESTRRARWLKPLPPLLLWQTREKQACLVPLGSRATSSRAISSRGTNSARTSSVRTSSTSV